MAVYIECKNKPLYAVPPSKGVLYCIPNSYNIFIGQ